MATQIKAVYGAAGFDDSSPLAVFNNPERIQEVLQTLKAHGVHNLDTAKLYGRSEELTGLTPGHEEFIIDTKWPTGFGDMPADKDTILAAAKDSLDKVKIPQFDIYYFHAPPNGSLEAALEGANEAYKAGIFKRLGVSNFTAEQVQEAYDICKSKGWVLPTVYQGNYNAVARHIEKTLFPTLRKLGIAFYAYSPIAGGFLVKTREQLLAGEARWSDNAIGGLYKGLYVKPKLLDALDTWNSIAEKEGISKVELAYRWVGYNSALKPEHGDAVIFGASKLPQISQTADYLKKGPLSDEGVKQIDQIWESIKEEAPVDNYTFFKNKQA